MAVGHLSMVTWCKERMWARQISAGSWLLLRPHVIRLCAATVRAYFAFACWYCVCDCVRDYLCVTLRCVHTDHGGTVATAVPSPHTRRETH